MRLKQLAVMVALVVISFTANATKYTCSGLVKGLSVSPQNGLVLAERIGELQWPRLCSISEDVAGIPADNCKLIYSTLLAAQLSNKTVTIWFNDSKDCSATSHPAWEELTGWYFGPRVND
ncbi:hypothetical protein AN944_00283 [Shewanella sp. P1-14-1]|uniref:hypothetical protein n=1 Tax=Shewanella sp. P1-14-1 TaxID=1723761 RepID=UPI0006D65791|nr:hypothetical protein [Shewanella sp. P1-14-1]KPZ73135.1 hypothetical protein AN944_00283 [Shewanella sp. P1-14-1]